jgi:predicted permease
METLLQDIRYALRGLRKAPAFTIVALLTLALGIGVNSGIFSVVNSILLRPLPVERARELVSIYGHAATSAEHETESYPNYVSFREQNTTLSGLAGYSNFFAHFALANASDLVIGEVVTDGYFSLLGVRPALGRAFTSEEFSVPGAFPVAVISDRLWRTRFAAATDVVGKTFRMNGITYTVIGVTRPEFNGMRPAVTAQMWIPSAMVEHVEPFGNQRTSGKSTGDTRLERRGQHWMNLVGRMKPGVTPAQVVTEFDAIARRLATDFPETNQNERVFVVPTDRIRFNPDFDNTIAAAGLVLVSAVSLVLLVACANLANLMLARATSRQREIAVRVAIGAPRKRLVRQLLTESMVLALAGGIVAVPIAAMLSRVIERVQPPLPVDFGLRISPDWRVLAFTFAAAIATGVIFGLIPALRASRPNLVPALKGSTTNGRKRLELRDALVVVQVAMSLVLVVAGALLVRSMFAAAKVPLGFDADHIAQLSVSLDMNGYNAERGGKFLEAGVHQLEAVPGVKAVGLASRVPLSLNNNGFGLFIDGRQSSSADKPFNVEGAYVDERYFAAMDVALVAGRGIEAADRDENRRVAVISRSMAQKYWPGDAENALGREFRLRWGADPYRVVGVVADYKVMTPGERPTPYLHLPFGRAETYGNFVVRSTSPALALLPRLQNELRALDNEIVFLDKSSLRDVADIRLFPVRAGAWLIGAFGMLALLVAAIGLYGVISYSVSRRVRELGIRKALGARPARLVQMVVREGMVLTAVGGVIGAALAAAASQALSSVLFVSAFDVVSFAASFGVLAMVALLAHVVPARRAAVVDPMIALRSE